MWLWDPPMNGGLYRQKIAEKIDSVGKLCFATCHQRPLKVNLLRNCSIASCLLDAMVRDIIQTRGTYLRSALRSNFALASCGAQLQFGCELNTTHRRN
jgi:hypothetical protein